MGHAWSPSHLTSLCPCRHWGLCLLVSCPMSPSTTKLHGLVPSARTLAKSYSMEEPLFPLSSPLSITHSLEPGAERTGPSPLTSCSVHHLQARPPAVAPAQRHLQFCQNWNIFQETICLSHAGTTLLEAGTSTPPPNTPSFGVICKLDDVPFVSSSPYTLSWS